MGRKKDDSIKGENKVTCELAKKIVGDRSYRQVADLAQINPSTLSYICRGMVKPTPEIIKKITAPNVNPKNEITYERFMIEAGYQNSTVDFLIEAGYQNSNRINSNIKRNLSEYAELIGKMDSERESMDNHVKRVREFLARSLLDLDYGIRKIPEEATRTDISFIIDKESIKIKKWDIEVFSVSSDRMRLNAIYRKIGQIVTYGVMGPDEKFSVFTENSADFDAWIRFKDKTSIRGEFSVILADLKEGKILREEYLSNYIEGNKQNEFTLLD